MTRPTTVTKKQYRQLITARNQLVKARGYVEKGWTQHTWARDKYDRLTDTHASNAKCFCTVGALLKAARIQEEDADKLDDTLALAYLNHVMASPKTDITKDRCVAIKVNDRKGTKQQQVLMSYDLAIILVEDELRYACSRVV
jgi:hypothetical protein